MSHRITHKSHNRAHKALGALTPTSVSRLRPGSLLILIPLPVLRCTIQPLQTSPSLHVLCCLAVPSLHVIFLTGIPCSPSLLRERFIPVHTLYFPDAMPKITTYSFSACTAVFERSGSRYSSGIGISYPRQPIQGSKILPWVTFQFGFLSPMFSEGCFL